MGYGVGIDPVGRGIASAVCLCTTSSVSRADSFSIPRRSLFVCIRTLLVKIPWSVHRFLPKQAPSLGRVLKLQATSLGAPEETSPYARTTPWSVRRFLPKQTLYICRDRRPRLSGKTAPFAQIIPKTFVGVTLCGHPETSPFVHTSPLPTKPVRNLTEKPSPWDGEGGGEADG